MKFYYYLWDLPGIKHVNKDNKKLVKESHKRMEELLTNPNTVSHEIYREIRTYLQIPMVFLSESKQQFELAIRSRIDIVTETLIMDDVNVPKEIIVSLQRDMEYILDQVRRQKVEFELYKTPHEVNEWFEKFIVQSDGKAVAQSDDKMISQSDNKAMVQSVEPNKHYNRIHWLGTKYQFHQLIDTLFSKQWIIAPQEKDTLPKLVQKYFTFPIERKTNNLSSTPNPFERIPRLDFQEERDQTLNRIIWYGKGVDLAELFYQLQEIGWIEKISSATNSGRAILNVFSILPLKEESFVTSFKKTLKDSRQKHFHRIHSPL